MDDPRADQTEQGIVGLYGDPLIPADRLTVPALLKRHGHHTACIGKSKNGRTVGVPTEFLPARVVGDNLASYSEPAMPYWHFEQLWPTWAKKADAYIRDNAGEDSVSMMPL
jgi:arylsulfatase A-like enzyme